MRNFRRLAILGLLVIGTLVGSPARSSGDDLPRPEAPIPIFLNAPTDRDAFWKLINRPDFVILDGEEYRKLRQLVEAARGPVGAPVGSVESVDVSGEVSGDWARLSVAIQVPMSVDGPAWIPIQLDGLALSQVREGDRDLPARMGLGRSWEVELRGKGDHSVVVTLMAPVRATAEGRRLDLPIAVAASTRIELKVPLKVVDAGTGLNEPAEVQPVEPGHGARLLARLGPRPRIELSWRERADPAVTLPALLTAQGEIAMEVERGAIRTRSSWVVGSLRGSISQLMVRLGAEEDVIDVEVDRRPVLVEPIKEAGRSVLIVPMAEPLRANTTRSLVINTRRPIASNGTVRVAVNGQSFDHARVQTGYLAIARSGPIFLNPTPGRGLRRIDPRTELPEGLRSRSDIALAFEFNDQPFELGLGVEPAPPRLLVENRTTIQVEPRSARVDTRLICRASQGRTFELAVLLPEGLEFEGEEPLDVVASSQSVPLNPKGAVGEGSAVPRVLTLTLTQKARESPTFEVHLKGRSVIDPSRRVSVPLFQPMNDPTTGIRFAILSDRNVLAEPLESPDETSAFRVDWEPLPTDWVWPTPRTTAEPGVLRLRADSRPGSLPLRVTVRPRAIRHESSMTATLDRKGAEVIDEVSGEVNFGTLSTVDLAIPPELPARWEVSGVDLEEGREFLGQDPDGTRRYRLKFSRAFADAFRVRIRYRLTYPENLTTDAGVKLRLTPVQILEGSSTGRQVRVLAEPSIELTTEAPGWSATPIPEPTSGTDQAPPIRVSLGRLDDRPGSVTIQARLGPKLNLPSPVVSRLWLRSDQRTDEELATSAWFWVETREGSMNLGLPPGSRWVRCRIGGREAGEREVTSSGTDEYLIRFPSTTPSGPVLVAVDYESPARSSSEGWAAPRVLGGGVIQQSVWEVRLLGNRAAVGTPSGWLEENDWSWDGWLWRRQPSKSTLELSEWLTGGNPRSRIAESLSAGDLSGRPNYLFSRPGPPINLKLPIFSRFTLVLLGSGPVLVAGLLILARRPPPRWLAMGALIVVFGVLGFVDLSVTIPLAQTAMPGVVLWLGAILINRFLDRRGSSRRAESSPGSGGSISPTSSIVSIPSAGSDDSTAIRVRPSVAQAMSTADHVHNPRIAPSTTSDQARR